MFWKSNGKYRVPGSGCGNTGSPAGVSLVREISTVHDDPAGSGKESLLKSPLHTSLVRA